MFYIILVISIIVISLIIGHISSSNNKPIGFKDDNFTIARSSISPDQKQLWHYASGGRKPRPEQAIKLESALHKLGEELLSISL